MRVKKVIQTKEILNNKKLKKRKIEMNIKVRFKSKKVNEIKKEDS